MKFRITLLLISLMLLFMACEMTECRASHNPFDPNDPNDPYVRTEYRMEVKVTYNRDPSKIRYPAIGRGIVIKYKLYDPEFNGKLEESERMELGYRIGSVKVFENADSENRYEGEIKHVLVQNEKYFKDHGIRIFDGRLYEEGVCDGWTVENIIVEGAYDIKLGSQMYFKEK